MAFFSDGDDGTSSPPNADTIGSAAAVQALKLSAAQAKGQGVTRPPSGGAPPSGGRPRPPANASNSDSGSDSDTPSKGRPPASPGRCPSPGGGPQNKIVRGMEA